MKFHDKEGFIPYNSPAKVFLQSQAVNLFLYMQKNIVKGESATMEATNLKHINLVSAAALRFLHL